MIPPLVVRIVPLIAGLTWLFNGLDVIAFSLIPGVFLLGGGISALLLGGDFRTPQLVAIGGLAGMISALLLVFSLDFSLVCWLLLLSVLSFVAAGRGFEGGQVMLADVPAAEQPIALAAKAALDEVSLGAAIRFMLRSPNSIEMDEIADETHLGIALLEAGGYLKSPVTWHQEPQLPDDISFSPGSLRGLDFQRMKFTSGFQPPIDFPGIDRWLSYQNNLSAHGLVLQHSGPPRPWMVCIHGGGMGRDAINLYGMQAAKFHRDHGLNVLLPVLPLHGARRMGRMSGAGIIGGYMTDTVFAMSQMVWDIRQMLAWIRSQGADRVGIYGISLGGYSTALLTQMEPELSCAIAGIPASRMAPMLGRLTEPRVVTGLAERGVGLAEIEDLFKVISPLAEPPQLSLDRRYMFAGVADRMVLPEHVAELWRHWDRPRIEWYQGSHVTWLWEKPAQNLLDEVVRNHLSAQK
jgi:pimeloyl-ACP methyl ester carboxylesterase